MIEKKCETTGAGSSSVYRFKFGLPTQSHALGLPIGKHIVLRFTDAEGRPVSRQYTPISSDEITRGYFELLVKLYPTGKMSQYLNNLPLNSAVEVRGPMGMFEYKGNGELLINRGGWKTQNIKSIGMIAGGSGITPMYQIMSHIARHGATDPTPCSLIFANITEDDILMRKELDELSAAHKRMNVFYTINAPRPNTDDKLPENWRGGVGFVSQEMITKHLPAPSDDTIILLCGPKPMIDVMKGHLSALGYTDDMIWAY